MKKILSAAVAVAALASSANAKGFNGFYAGMDIGLKSTNTKFKATRSDKTITERVAGNSNNTVLGIILGYNKVFSNCMTLGGLFTSEFTFGGKKTLQHNDRFKLTQKSGTYSWGLLATAGVLVNPKSTVFVGLGVKSVNNTLNYSEFDTNGGQFRVKNSKVRFTTLVGHETLLASDAVALRVTYGFTPAATKSFAIRDSRTQFVVGGVNGKGKFRTAEHQVKLGVAYKF